jgi:hypothetical protein
LAIYALQSDFRADPHRVGGHVIGVYRPGDIQLVLHLHEDAIEPALLVHGKLPFRIFAEVALGRRLANRTRVGGQINFDQLLEIGLHFFQGFLGGP